MVTDPIADMLTRIRNANQQRHEEVMVPASKLKVELAEILKNEGFIKGYKVEGEGVAKNIVITTKLRPCAKITSDFYCRKTSHYLCGKHQILFNLINTLMHFSSPL